MNWLHNVEVVLFDLDGTLYQDGTFYKRYMELLFGNGEYAARLDDLLAEMALLLDGGHSSRIGDWYHPGSDSWSRGCGSLVYWNWQGQVVEAAAELTAISSIYAGDAWSLVSIFAAKYGVGEAQRQQAFQQVRKEMLQGASSFERHHGLYESIGNLTGVRKRILLTNSPENTGREFISALACTELFDEIVYGAGKPSGLEQYMTEMMEREGLRPDQILSIGDHAWNDLYPVRKLGGYTVWLSPYPTSETEQWDVQLSTLDQLTALLVELQEAKLQSR
ncbi:FMN phosphatase YigB, HAD superfamily [Paenibacillus sp. 1_12]|uniref:HAD family hydrolase n=1 Tax=Paenibacillus sp. 1_12 TaxID=1566278 RepID=UPI0008EB96E0|nr:HAD family hydrolase [Paenibacillus sp. 1_12]SFK96512.1 FMN phosphatase YigB, HAD superfamily [Paenibacillus sp. 1_12]